MVALDWPPLGTIVSGIGSMVAGDKACRFPNILAGRRHNWRKNQGITMDVDSNAGTRSRAGAQPDRGRREFVRQTGKALYVAPALTLLASAPASALPTGGPPPPPGSFSAPEPPPPTE